LEAVRDAAGIERAIEQFAREPNGGLIPLPSPLIGLRRDLIISLASRHRLPNVYGFRYYPIGGHAHEGVAGGLAALVPRTSLGNPREMMEPDDLGG
jgi:hypothetical protein